MPKIPTSAEVEQLIEAGAAERVDLEFKSRVWERSDQGKREALKDITALANTRGGVILVGVAEENNAAKALAPLTSAEAESERSRINDLVCAGVEPRLYGVSIEAVNVVGGVVLALAIPRSPSRPHRITTGASNRFWLRNSTGVYEANVSDLRSLFLQSAEITERAERFHRGRIRPAISGDIVANLSSERGAIVLHVIPADAFSQTTVIDPARAHELQESFRPLGGTDFSPRFTFDGFLNVRGGPQCHGYTLVRRDGIIEAVKVGLSGGANLPAYPTEARIVRGTHRFIEGLVAAGAVPPFYCYVTIDGAGDRLLVHQSYIDEDSTKISPEDLHLPVAVIEEVSTPEVAGNAFKAAFDALWNSGGYAHSLGFENGQWRQRARES